MSRDVIAEFRAQDPARRAALGAVDPGALAALREGITMTGRTTTVRSMRRLGRRGLLAGGLAVALAGGGVAFAATQLSSDEEATGTTPMGIECQEVFGEGYPADGATVAASLTGDPVADCATFRAEEGLDPLPDPVAFVVDGTLYVTPRDQVPHGADVVDVDAAVAAVHRELQASLGDVVDGGAARCLPEAEAVAWAESELGRLGLAGWSVEVVHGSDDEGAYACSAFEVGNEPQTVQVYPGLEPPVEEWTDAAMLDTLRGIEAQCLPLDEAYDVVERMLGDEHHVPTTRVVDEAASCTRVDMEVGGSYRVTLYGPTSVG